MLMLQKKKHGISFITVWYAKEPMHKAGIIQYREALFKPEAASTEFETLLSDLTETEEEIIAKYSKNCRYEVRRAAKENIQVEMKTGASLTEADIEEFCDFFVEFWASKGVEYKDADNLKEEIREYATQDAFAITSASVNGKKIIYHTYVVEEACVRLYHSASLYRLDEDVPQSLVGMANRYLHKEDMLYFKQQGKAQYDWGGAGMTEEVINITKFKQSFGGTPVTYYDFTEVNGAAAKLITGLSEVKNGMQKRQHI